MGSNGCFQGHSGISNGIPGLNSKHTGWQCAVTHFLQFASMLCCQVISLIKCSVVNLFYDAVALWRHISCDMDWCGLRSKLEDRLPVGLHDLGHCLRYYTYVGTRCVAGPKPATRGAAVILATGCCAGTQCNAAAAGHSMARVAIWRHTRRNFTESISTATARSAKAYWRTARLRLPWITKRLLPR